MASRMAACSDCAPYWSSRRSSAAVMLPRLWPRRAAICSSSVLAGVTWASASQPRCARERRLYSTKACKWLGSSIV